MEFEIRVILLLFISDILKNTLKTLTNMIPNGLIRFAARNFYLQKNITQPKLPFHFEHVFSIGCSIVYAKILYENYQKTSIPTKVGKSARTYDNLRKSTKCLDNLHGSTKTVENLLKFIGSEEDT